MPSFILDHLDEILTEWEAFARTMTPAAITMSTTDLRAHARQMLQAIASDIATPQSDEQKELKSRGLAPAAHVASAASAHGVLRQRSGFDLVQLVSEFRALRAGVLRIWLSKERFGDAPSAYEMARFNESIDQALGEAVATYSAELAASRDMFLGILGHDLRTPLGAIWGAIEILANTTRPGQRASAHAAATRSLVSMRAMINDLLEYTRTRLGKGIGIIPTIEDLETIVKDSLEEMSLAYPAAAFALASEGATQGAFDRERMHQVLSNLLGNAIQHGDPASPVQVRTGGDKESLWLQVTNRGAIIAPDHLRSIFDPLVQLADESPEAPRSSNLGLGLYIAREIVLAHGGTIEASSSAESGTTFAVSLPRLGAKTSS